MNLKRTGLVLLVLTVLILTVTGYLGINGLWRLTLGAFGFGAASVLIFFGGIVPPEE